LVNANNVDTTEALLTQQGPMMILFAKTWNKDWNDEVKALATEAAGKNIPFIVSTSVPELVMENVNVPVMKSDYVAIKTAARVDPTLYYLENGTIVSKSALQDAAEKYK
jgi:hypothetical protein